MILYTLDEYRMGRTAPAEVMERGGALLLKANQLVAHYLYHFPDANRPALSSGYRTPEINAATEGAARGSQHVQGNALDLRDSPCLLDGRMRVRPFGRWCVANLHVLADLDLWMEDPRCTPTWVHVQQVPPGSGNRVFIPDANWAARLVGRPLTPEGLA